MSPGETNGDVYWYVTPEEMIRDISENQFVEYGEFDGNYYGTKFETVRRCVRSGRMCILDISPQVELRRVFKSLCVDKSLFSLQ